MTVKASGMKLMIAVPAYQSQFCGEFVRSLFMMSPILQRMGVQTSLSEIDTPDIVLARNYLISHFYYITPEWTHILFIDSDMGFPSSLIVDMLEFGKEVVGVVAPRRKIDLARLHSLGGTDFNIAKAASLDFLCDSTKAHTASGKFLKVESCGTGIMLISRKAIDTLVAKCPEVVDNTGYMSRLFNINFDKFIKPFNRIQTETMELSEDLSFCHRWTRQCDGEVWASFDHPIQHVGRFVFEGRYSDLLKPTPRPEK